MSEFKLEKMELNYSGIGQLLKSTEMSNALMACAQQIAGNAGEGYKAKIMSSRVIVIPETKEAEKDNYKNNTLLKSRR